ncbi:MAG: FAD-binding protein, partial [Gammaproteobacteria bacterium]
MEVSGWGRYPRIEAEFHQARDARELRDIISGTSTSRRLIASGAGRSYGDSALADVLLNTSYFDNFMEFDRDLGLLRCGAGTSLTSILKTCLPYGWIPAVLPGTQYVTVGGAIAADIHGKNHHLEGTFSSHLHAITLLLASGEQVHCSSEDNS